MLPSCCMVAACWPLTPVEQELEFTDSGVVRDFLLMNLESWWPPTLLLSVSHSAFPFSTFTRYLCGVVGLTHQAKWLGKGRAHWGGFDACEIGGLFWSKCLGFLLHKSGGALLTCKAGMKLICLSFSLLVCSFVFALSPSSLVNPSTQQGVTRTLLEPKVMVLNCLKLLILQMNKQK